MNYSAQFFMFKNNFHVILRLRDAKLFIVMSNIFNDTNHSELN